MPRIAPIRSAATLPFGGATLIEYQARLLAAVGASHLLVAVSRVTPGAARRDQPDRRARA